MYRIGNKAFAGCGALQDVYFGGTREAWRSVSVGSGNEALRAARIHCSDGLFSYTVSFDANGGGGAPAAQQKTPGEPLLLTDAVPARDGWYFVGWAESADAAEAEYLPGDSFVRDADTVLYAVWAAPDLILPAELSMIEAEAFANCAARFALLPEGVLEIGSGAFAGCQGLQYVYIPASCALIDEDAFSGAEGLRILGVHGSEAESFAGRNGLPFIPTA